MKMRVVSVRIPDWMIDKAYILIEKGIFISFSELVRYAIRKLLREYLEVIKNEKNKDNKDDRISYEHF